MRATSIAGFAAAALLLLAACNPAPKAPEGPPPPAPESNEGRALLQLETRLATKVKLEHTRSGVLNDHKLYCGDAVTPDGKRRPFALSNGYLFLTSDGGPELMADMQKACDAGVPPAAAATPPAPAPTKP